MSDAWDESYLIKHWETSNRFSYTCMKGQLHCDSCGFSTLVKDFDKKYEDLHVKTNEWFDFIDPFLKVLYHTYHRTTEKMTARKFYLVFLDIKFPFESWRQSIPPVIHLIVQHKLPHIITLFFNCNHFAVLEIFLDKLEFIIFDGLDVDGTGMIRWSKHFTHVLATVGVVPTHSKGERLRILIMCFLHIVAHESESFVLTSSYCNTPWIINGNGFQRRDYIQRWRWTFFDSKRWT